MKVCLVVLCFVGQVSQASHNAGVDCMVHGILPDWPEHVTEMFAKAATEAATRTTELAKRCITAGKDKLVNGAVNAAVKVVTNQVRRQWNNRTSTVGFIKKCYKQHQSTPQVVKDVIFDYVSANKEACFNAAIQALGSDPKEVKDNMQKIAVLGLFVWAARPQVDQAVPGYPDWLRHWWFPLNDATAAGVVQM